MDVTTFKENYDLYAAYNSWISIAEAKNLGMIPEKYWDYFPDHCDCGSDNIVSLNLKRCMCCDPRCEIKESYRLAEFLHRSNIAGFGASNCATILKYLKLEDSRRLQNDPSAKPFFEKGTYLEAFNVPYNDYPVQLYGTSVGYNFYQASLKLKSTPITFAKLVSNLGIPSLGSNALNLFRGINSVIQLLEEIQKQGGLRAFCSLRGVYDTEVLHNLYEAMSDIIYANDLFRGAIRLEGVKNIKICITGRVVCDGSSMTKSEFIDYLNKLCINAEGVPLFEWQNTSAMQSVPFIVYSTASNSAKFRAGQARGSITDCFGEHSVLITANDLVTLLKGFMHKLAVNDTV